MVALLTAHFQPGSYDLLRKNCNSFSSPLSAMIQWQKLLQQFQDLPRSSLPKQEKWQQDTFSSSVGKVSLDDASLHKCCCHSKAAPWNIWWMQRSLDANNARMTDGWWSCFDFLYLHSENILMWTVCSDSALDLTAKVQRTTEAVNSCDVKFLVALNNLFASRLIFPRQS